MTGVRKRAFSGVFIEENAHRSRSPCFHLQGKWSSPRRFIDGRLPAAAAREDQPRRQKLRRLASKGVPGSDHSFVPLEPAQNDMQSSVWVCGPRGERRGGLLREDALRIFRAHCLRQESLRSDVADACPPSRDEALPHAPGTAHIVAHGHGHHHQEHENPCADGQLDKA